MSSLFRKALQIIRERSNNTTELGTAFEKMVKVFLENDPTQIQQYEKVWTYKDWASNREGYSGKDIGIDLVAKIRDQETFCAIQCKCYDNENQIGYLAPFGSTPRPRSSNYTCTTHRVRNFLADRDMTPLEAKHVYLCHF